MESERIEAEKARKHSSRLQEELNEVLLIIEKQAVTVRQKERELFQVTNYYR